MFEFIRCGRWFTNIKLPNLRHLHQQKPNNNFHAEKDILNLWKTLMFAEITKDVHWMSKKLCYSVLAPTLTNHFWSTNLFFWFHKSHKNEVFCKICENFKKGGEANRIVNISLIKKNSNFSNYILLLFLNLVFLWGRP